MEYDEEFGIIFHTEEWLVTYLQELYKHKLITIFTLYDTAAYCYPSMYSDTPIEFFEELTYKCKGWKLEEFMKFRPVKIREGYFIPVRTAPKDLLELYPA